MKKEFQAALVGRGPGNAWVFLPIPFDVEEVFGKRSRVPVKGTINGYPFRNSLLPEGDGTHSMAVNKELQNGATAGPGDLVAVVMEADTDDRVVVVPDDLAAALGKSDPAKGAFDALAYSHKKEYVDWIEDAKKPETRQRRILKAVEMLSEGKRLRS